MGTLSSCLKKIGLSKHEAAILRGATDDNIKDGDEAHVAAVRAVSDFIEQLEKERAGVVAQIDKAGGVAPMAPFKLADLAELTAALRRSGDLMPTPYNQDKQPEKENVTNEPAGNGVERDRQDANTENEVGDGGIRDGRPGDDRPDGPGVPGGREGQRHLGGVSADGFETAAPGEFSDFEIYAAEPDVSPGATGGDNNFGGGQGGFNGVPIEPVATEEVDNAATERSDLAASVEAQARANQENPRRATLREEIDAALPLLQPLQREDVMKAELRFAQDDGYGMLFTNGTGTGKTFIGLGVIRRFVNDGKTNILIVAPSSTIINQWVASGKLFGLDINRLESKQDAGQGVVMTTFANFSGNDALVNRQWDLVLMDEAHKLMQGEDGSMTSALTNLRAISYHPAGASHRHSTINAADIAKLKDLDETAKTYRVSDNEQLWHAATGIQAQADKLREELTRKREAIIDEVNAYQGAARTRVLFLSATPFAWDKTIDWANGYLFDYNEGRSDESKEFRGYNVGSNQDQFFMQHLGWRMRTGKLTEPDAKVNRGLMQRQFNSWMKKRGVLSGRMLEVDADYDRKFIMVESAIGRRIDEALDWFAEQRKAHNETKAVTNIYENDPYINALHWVHDAIRERFDSLSRRYLLEAIKAKAVIEHVHEHMALGRKVVVVHDFLKGGGFNPFDVDFQRGQPADEQSEQAMAAYNRVVREFRAEFADLINAEDFKSSSPLDTFRQAIPGVLIFNGAVTDKVKAAAVKKFNDDASGPQVLLANSAAIREGVSLHDTTGKHPRVMFNLGLPTAPTAVIQLEGRTYRVGQASDAMFRYLNTGTRWEEWAFATKIAERASTAENLGMGEQARSLRESFIEAFADSGDYRAGMEGEGKGGKAMDRAANDAMTDYDRAKSFYFGQQKKTSKNKAAEGADYFATPEPVGLKMVEFAGIRGGNKVLEPSAGHGAIARWFPENAQRTAIEPSGKLMPRLAMVFSLEGGKIIEGDFESHNVVNKYDAIVMNPPFGTGGKLAIEHLAKAATHLNDGGRIVALLPSGPMADKRLEKWLYGEEERAIKPLMEHPTLGAVYRGDTLTTRAGWAPEGKVVRRDSAGNIWIKPEGRPESMVNPAAWTAVKATGARKETYKPADNIYMVADIKLPGVTFERAGTGVMTHIVVLEKQTDVEKAPQQIGDRDYSRVEDINELFDKLENVTLPNRPMTEAEIAAEQAEQEAPARNSRPAKAEKPAVDMAAAQAQASAEGLEIIEYTTKKGKKLKGVIRTDLTKEQAQAIDKFTWKMNGGYFIRAEHMNSDAYKQSLGGEPPTVLSKKSGGDTIMVDGIERPTLNSNGKPIHPTEEGVRNFWRWFGDSKVVDAQGRPMVVYHGTGSDFDAFSKEKLGSSTRVADAKEGFFFTTSGNDASEYAWKDGEPGSVMPVYLRIENPYVSDMVVHAMNNRDFAGILKDAKKQGNDGAAAFLDTFGRESSVFVAFSPEQIKSATGNNGDFDQSEPNITLSASPAGNDRNAAVVVDAVAANDAIAATMAGLKSPPEVTLVDSFSDLPQEVQDEAKEQDAGEREFKGALKRGHIWILRANHASVEDVQTTLFHELYGHYGTRALFGNQWMQEINKLFALVGGWNGIKAIAAKRGIDLESYRKGVLNWEGDKKIWREPVMMEELLAHIAEQQANPTLMRRVKDAVKRLVGQFRQWLRDKGMATLAERGETDLLHMLSQAAQAVREGKSVRTGPAMTVLSRDSGSLDFVSDVLNELSFEDGLFRHMPSKSKTIQGNIEHAMQGAEYLNSDAAPEELEHEDGKMADRRLTFAAPSGKIFYVYTAGNEVWVDISRLLPGDRGGAIYHAIANYAINAGKVFIGDPNGLSEDAIVRRTAAMLSSALRFGTTEHFQPSKQQLKGVPSKGIEPLAWSANNHVENIKSLVDNYVKTLQNTFPEIKDYRYDFDKHQFLDRDGAPVNKDGFKRIAKGSHVASAGRAGEASLRRGIFLQSLMASPRSGQPGLLETFLRGSGELVRQGQPLHAVFRRGADQVASGYGRGATDGVRSGYGRDSSRVQEAQVLGADDAPAMMRRSASDFIADKLQQSSPKFADAIRDAFTTNEKFNWWHKTLGTQHHKAHLDKDFAKVYHTAQAFERDTARMASEAADLAPDLLPKMDGIGDTLRTAKNVKRDAQDSFAISPWVFYGTLAEQVFTDEQLRNPDMVIEKFGKLLPDDQPLKPLTDRQIGLYRQYHAAINKSLEDLAISEMGRLARMAKLNMADPSLTMAETARFYFDQIADEIQRLSGALEELQEEQKAEASLLEDAANDEATGAEQRKRYAKMLMDMKAKHKEQAEKITAPLADLLNMKEHFIGRALKIKELQDQGYAPLMRFGKYTVDVTLQDKDGKVLTDADGNELRPFFGMFESEAEANAVARELREEYPDHTVTQGVLSEHQHQLFQGVSPENVELYAKAVGMDTDEAFQRYLKVATANRSAMKRLIHRKGTAGFSFDVSRSLASFITSNSRAASSNLHIGDMLKAVADIDKTKGDVKDEAIKLMEYVRSPAEGGVAIRSLLFFQYLGGSVAAALVNMTQTFTTTMPYLSQPQFGGPKKAADELRKAMALAAKRMRGGSTGDKALDALLKKAEEEGVVAPHEIHMLQGEGSRGSGAFANSPVWRSLENKYPALRFTSRFIDAGKSLWGSFFSLAEQYNRQVAFIAAYQLAKQSGKSEAQAYAIAEQAVEETQFNYQKSARPNWARSAVGATLLTFKTFLINYLEFLNRLPKRERMIALGMLVLLAGAQGAPGADDADDIIDTLGQAAGYSTNAKRWKREVLGDIFGNGEFGQAASGFLLHGVSAFLPFDISGRLSVGNIIPATSLFKRDNTSTTDEVAELVGPAGGLAKKLYEGAKGAISGDDPARTLMYVAAPKAIADAYQGVDMLQTGIYRDYRGRKVTDASALDAAAKAIGFQPSSVAEVKRGERLVQQDIALFRNVKQDIAERWARGIFERDTAKVQKARDELREWNEKNPSLPMAVKNSQIQRRVTEMKKTSGERVAGAAPKEIRGNVEHVLRSGELQ